MKKMMLFFIFTWSLYSKSNTPIIEKNIESFKHCYTEGLKFNSNLKGKIILEWEVDQTGSVKKVKVKSTTINNSTVENCMIDNLKTMKFPPAPNDKTVSISYPFVFSP